MDVFEDLQDKDIRIGSTAKYTDDYKNKVFTIWYNEGKPPPKTLFEKIPPPETNYGVRPSETTLKSWVFSQPWKKRANDLDAGVRQSVDLALIQTKVEMLERHARLGEKMQDMGIEYLEDHKDDITAQAAVRLIVEGVRIQVESMGIPGALAKLTRLPDEQLLEEIKKLIEETPMEDEIINE